MSADSSSPAGAPEIAFYQDQGYIQFQHFFTAAQMAALRAAIDEAIARNRERIRGAPQGGRISETYERVFNQMVNLWTDCPAAKAITFDQRLGETARRLAGAAHVRLYHDHAMVKPGGPHSRQTNWHQDAPYWPMDPVGALSAWIAVDDVTEENGCLHFIGGTHHFGKLEGIHLGSDEDSIVTKMGAKGVKLPPSVAMPMAAGGVTFHHGCTFHHAAANRSAAPRRAFAIIYIPAGTRFTGGRDAGGAANEMKAGGPWDHPLHPILAP